MSLKYYAEENNRHQDVLVVKWTFQQCKEATNLLCDHYGLPRIVVKLRSGGRSSSYNTGSRRIRYLPSMLNPLTVAHEFAHYRDHMFRIKERDDRNNKVRIAATDQFGFYQSPFKLVGIDCKTRWHGIRHRMYTDQAVAFVKTLSFYVPAKVTRMETIRTAAEAEAAAVKAATTYEYRFVRRTAQFTAAVFAPFVDVVAAAFAALPEYCTCPKCHLSKSKRDFGMRIMARDPVTKVPTKAVRQSYCQECR